VAVEPVDARPRVVHVIHRLGTGGMENGLVNLINRMPPERYAHAVVCLTDAGPFAERIKPQDVPIAELHHPGGHSFRLYGRLWRVLRGLRPSLVHTRNLAALEGQFSAALLPGVARVHGEHGRDVFDLHGSSRKYNLLRRAVRPLVDRYIAVSRDLQHWLVRDLGVREHRVVQIYNGVDAVDFQAVAASRVAARRDLLLPGFAPEDALVIGTVGRLAEVKDQLTLIQAFAMLCRRMQGQCDRLRLVIVGEGPLRARLEEAINRTALGPQVWLAGERADVPAVLGGMDLFVLPSLGEGISNTVLEAMASGLPVVATRVGGNPELVDDRVTGALVRVSDPAAMADAMISYIADPKRRQSHGAAGRDKVVRQFRWDRCVQRYLDVYDAVLAERGMHARPAAADSKCS